MIVKMKEHYQDARVHFAPDQEVEVDDNLGRWLVENRKALPVVKHLEVEPQFEQAEEPPHYGGQEKAEPRRDETKHQKVKEPRRGRGAK